MKKGDSKKGFTIIEVALVLAVAGLIFLMVFIALPAIQRTQRDSKRREDVGVLLTAIQKYQNNNRGATLKEADLENFKASYIEGNFEDPAGYPYELLIGACNVQGIGNECTFGADANDGSISFDGDDNEHKYTMYIIQSATCNGSAAVSSGNFKKIAVLYKMEVGGQAYCANMQ